METKSIDIDIFRQNQYHVNSLSSDHDNSDATRTNIFNTSRFRGYGELPLPEQTSGFGRQREGRLKRFWNRRGRLILCISLLFLFLVNIILDLKQIEKNSFDMGSGGTYNPKKSKLST
mmetsp:Transcript_9763/g.9544  ORF Transcript_9763/g.9544 Transcript_9763/m.9544 type:complete len:118 (+) Transcript_9763:43-396(+)